MPHSKREILAVAERRAKVAELLLRGLRQVEIAEALGLGTDAAGQMTVSRDLKAVREQWKASGVRAFDEAKGRVLAELALTMKEAWAAWERSKVGKDGPREGNPRYLSTVLDCVRQECEILGLTSSAPVIVQQAIQGAPVQMTPAERLEAVRAILTACNRPWNGGPESEAGQLLALVDSTNGAPVEVNGTAGDTTNGEAVPADDAGRIPYGLREIPSDDHDDVEPLFG